MEVTKLTDNAFAETIKDADKPLIVEFGASWCGPCRALDPLLKQIAEEYQDRVKVYKMDFDDAQKSAVDMQVRSIPTTLFFNSGELQDRLIGAVPKSALVDRVEALVA